MNKKNKKNKNCYIYVGNHHSLIGVWEQVKITLRAFNKLDIPIQVSAKIIPNHVNIIIEEFNEIINSRLIEIKKKYPDTEFILYVSEYISKNGSLNIFNSKQKILRFIFKLLPNVLLRNYNDTSKLKDMIINYINGFLYLILKKINVNYNSEKMMARREKFLLELKNKNLFTFIISTTKRVLQNYDTIFNIDSYYVPIFVNTSNLSKRASQGYKRSIIFSGNLTPHRIKILEKFNRDLYESNPLHITFLRDLNSKEYKNYMSRLNELTVLGYSCVFLPESKIFKIQESLYNSNKKESGLFEIYIPQSNKWNVSSPNRTLLSLEEGFIPIDYGDFDDHSINKIPYKVSSIDDILQIVLFDDLDNRIKETLKKIDSYNKEEMRHLPILKEKIISIL